MTNEEIISKYKYAHNIPAETCLFTFARWKEMGYCVKKGERSRHKVLLWQQSKKMVQGKDGNISRSTACFLKTAYLFEDGQVERMK